MMHVSDHRWMCPDVPLSLPHIVVYRNRFKVDKQVTLRFRFSADEHAELFLDDEYLTAGPERGSLQRWYFQHGGAVLAPGEHTLTARVLCFGSITAHAQMSLRHGFFFEEEGLLTSPQWEWSRCEHCTFHAPFPDWGVYPRIEVGEGFNWSILAGQGGQWRPVRYFTDTRPLHPPALPAMRREYESGYHRQGSWMVFDEYFCGWSDLTFTGQGLVRLRWSETPYLNHHFDAKTLKGDKGRRDGKVLVGNGDTLSLPGGQVRWRDFHWRAGRVLEIDCSQGVTLKEACFHRTGYPFERECYVAGLPEPVKKVFDLSEKTLAACAHETYMDCPYYEQLMYISDTRIQTLVSYQLTQDDRLATKALRLFADGLNADGTIYSRYPSRVPQVIPLFSAIYILMLHDHARWRDEEDLIVELLPAARKIMEYFRNARQNGLIAASGWNFIDWVSGWDDGVPPGAEQGGCTLHLMVMKAMQALAEMEDHFGGHGEVARTFAQELGQTIHHVFYDDRKGLYAEDTRRRLFSEHAQVMALLAMPSADLIERFSHERFNDQAGIAFSFYYLEACYQHGLAGLFHDRLERWHQFEHEGLTTLPEEFDKPRSDCHAWGAHPLFHIFASVLGIRPAAFGFSRLEVRPLQVKGVTLQGAIPHPQGKIMVSLDEGHIEVDSPVPYDVLPGSLPVDVLPIRA